ncbi:nucleotidyl transferase AbiEii/AbiGii toxin family protein [Thermodesulfobium narugense]|uniref:nucleotidyl transferase AbiEii/AbiGii toxin family protein n=1 Tax=Thermodesulfobium narugense TaxID=184064 RepID=UPI001C5490C0|nr:nucleotidyl transferase AbiEii/AbiGii toxin family protein [Thermodesulfobium narugense]
MKLTRQQLSALEVVLSYGIDEGFYLTGGTALTIKYNHRHSEDFVFFTIPGFNFDVFKLSKKN